MKLEEQWLALFTVELHTTVEGRLAIWPGIQRDLFRFNAVTEISPGSELQLSKPDGSRQIVTVHNFFLSVSEGDSPEEVRSLPLIIILSGELTLNDVPIGTKVLIFAGTEK